MTTQNKCETPVELNNIKEALNKIPDTQLALDILTNLESLANIQKQQSDALAKSESELKRIQDVNQSLMLRATAINSTLPPSTSVTYNDIDPVQSIIDRI